MNIWYCCVDRTSHQFRNSLLKKNKLRTPDKTPCCYLTTKFVFDRSHVTYISLPFAFNFYQFGRSSRIKDFFYYNWSNVWEFFSFETIVLKFIIVPNFAFDNCRYYLRVHRQCANPWVSTKNKQVPKPKRTKDRPFPQVIDQRFISQLKNRDL